jgi:hypothetical protein
MADPAAQTGPDAPAPAGALPSGWGRWRAYGITVFVTFHLTCVVIEVLPYPLYTEGAILQHPEVAAELDTSTRALHRLLPYRDSPREIQDDLLSVAGMYARGAARGRALVEPYLNLVGSTQIWNMFGGTPPRFPLVFVVEVRPRGADHFILFQDLNWGTADSAALNFRHRKAQEGLSLGGDRDAYAAYWARRWDRLHPDRPAEEIRLSYLQLHTPRPAEVRRGETDRHPAPDFEVHLWQRAP